MRFTHQADQLTVHDDDPDGVLGVLVAVAAGVVAAVVDDGALDGEDADDVAGGGPENGADPETRVTICYQ